MIKTIQKNLFSNTENSLITFNDVIKKIENYGYAFTTSKQYAICVCKYLQKEMKHILFKNYTGPSSLNQEQLEFLMNLKKEGLLNFVELYRNNNDIEEEKSFLTRKDLCKKLYNEGLTYSVGGRSTFISRVIGYFKFIEKNPLFKDYVCLKGRNKDNLTQEQLKFLYNLSLADMKNYCSIYAHKYNKKYYWEKKKKEIEKKKKIEEEFLKEEAKIKEEYFELHNKLKKPEERIEFDRDDVINFWEKRDDLKQVSYKTKRAYLSSINSYLEQYKIFPFGYNLAKNKEFTKDQFDFLINMSHDYINTIVSCNSKHISPAEYYFINKIDKMSIKELKQIMGEKLIREEEYKLILKRNEIKKEYCL